MEHNIEDISKYFNCRKADVYVFLKKHFKENIDYKIEKSKIVGVKYGGQNKKDILLTRETYEMVKNTYNLRQNRNVKYHAEKQNVEITYVNRVMNLEQSTIGFVYDCFKSTTLLKLQFKVKTYKIDCYFIDYKIALECDENNHEDRDIEYESIREKELVELLGCKFIRFNPNDPNFKLQQVISHILENIQ